jgi:hypothetical protein
VLYASTATTDSEFPVHTRPSNRLATVDCRRGHPRLRAMCSRRKHSLPTDHAPDCPRHHRGRVFPSGCSHAIGIPMPIRRWSMIDSSPIPLQTRAHVIYSSSVSRGCRGNGAVPTKPSWSGKRPSRECPIKAVGLVIQLSSVQGKPVGATWLTAPIWSLQLP